MEKKRNKRSPWRRVMTAVLLVTLCVGLCTVFTLDHTMAATEPTLYLNRTFGESGISDKAGLSPIRGEQGVKKEGSNSYWQIKNTGDHAYLEITPNTSKQSQSVVTLELRLRFDTNAVGATIELRDTNDWNAEVLSTSYSGGNMTLTSGGTQLAKVAVGSGVWVKLAFVFDLKNDKIVSLSVNGTQKLSGATIGFSKMPSYGQSTDSDYLKFIRINGGTGTSNSGKTVGIDDIVIYSGSTAKTWGANPGILVDSYYTEKAYTTFLKVGVPRAMAKGNLVDIVDGTDGAPVKVNDEVYVPLAFVAGLYNFGVKNNGNSLYLTGPRTVTVTRGSTAATVAGAGVTLTTAPIVSGGQLMLNYKDIPAVLGLQVAYDSMGIVQVSSQPITLTRESNKTAFIDIISSFIYIKRTGSQMISDMESHLGSLDVHPRIQVDMDRFNEIRDTYYKGTSFITGSLDEQMAKYAVKAVSDGEASFNRYFTGSGSSVSWLPDKYFWQPYMNYDGDTPAPADGKSKTYTDKYGTLCYGDGYDDGGRSGLSSYTTHMKRMAFSYRMTGDVKYARAVYLAAQAVGKWAHWGEGHFLNNADGAVLYATAFDWVYDALSESERREMAQILFERAIFPTWGQFQNPRIYTFRSVRANAGQFASTTNNWMTVCCSGEMAACIAIAEYTDLTCTYEGKTYTSGELIPDIMGRMLDSCPNCFDVYVPDGSYVESPGYWDYGTNTFFLMCENLMSAMGTTYGLMEAPGIDRTCYFATHIESSDYKSWNYHDGGSGAMPTQNFSFVGQYYGDETLVALRYQQLANGKSLTYEDLLYYDPDFGTGAGVTLPSSYYSEGIDTTVVRSSWEKGAIYAGLHAGKNNVSHGQIDAGNFILYKGMTRYFLDLGSDNYNLPEYFSGNTRYHYYRMNGEGHNTVVLAGKSDMEWGQTLNGIAYTVDYQSAENGAYSIVDMTGVYGGYATSARRGMLFTNGRRTLIIQDEMTFKEKSRFYWLAHTDVGAASITLSEDGKTAMLKGDDGVLRVTLLDPDGAGLTFQVMDTVSDDSLFLSGTYTKQDVLDKNAQVTAKGEQLEYDRSAIRKLVVTGEATSLKMAVVMDFIEFDTDAVGYAYTPMANWNTASMTDGKDLLLKNLQTGMDAAEAKVMASETAGEARAAVLSMRAYLESDEIAELLATDPDLRAITEVALARADAALSGYVEREIAAREDALDVSAYKGTRHIDATFPSLYNMGGLSVANKSGGSENSGIVQDPDGNCFYRITGQLDKGTIPDCYLHTNVAIAGGDLVVEYDFRAHRAFTGSTTYFRYNSLYVSGASVTPLEITTTGAINIKDENKQTVYREIGALKLEEWTKISLVLHQTARTLDLYLDNVLVVSGVKYLPDGHENGFSDAAQTKPVTSTSFNIRITHGSGRDGDVDIDNVRIYRSSVPLDVEHHYTRLAELAADGSASLADRKKAVKTAKSLVSTGQLPMNDATAAAEELLDTAEQELPRIEQAESLLSGLKYNLSLYAGFDINLYLPVLDKILAVRTAPGGANLLNGKTTVIDGKTYMVATTGVNANEATRAVCFYIEIALADGTTATVERWLSVAEYSRSILSGSEHTKDDRTLVMALLDYAQAATRILDGVASAELAELLSTYSTYAPTPVTSYGAGQDITPLRGALLGACLNLDDSPDFLFFLRTDFRGTLTFSYVNYSGKTVSRTVTADGTVDRVSIDTMHMYEFGSVITVTATGTDGKTVTGKYDLDTYLRGVMDEGEEISDFASAIYTYVKVALSYKKSQK